MHALESLAQMRTADRAGRPPVYFCGLRTWFKLTAKLSEITKTGAQAFDKVSSRDLPAAWAAGFKCGLRSQLMIVEDEK